jgi:cyanophycinase
VSRRDNRRVSAIHLIGGGRDAGDSYRRFIADCPGTRPRIATVLIDEGDGATDVSRFIDALRDAGECEPTPVLVPIGDTFDPAALDGMDGLFVGGGLTPAYAAAITPVAAALREWLEADGHVYAGFSAGAAIAARRALVGGWLLDGVLVCPADSAEDLEELSAVDGLDLVPFAVDVHGAQWGTLSRLSAAVESGAIAAGVGIDEDTMLTIAGGVATASGAGRVWVAKPDRAGLSMRVLTAGDRVDVSELSS